MKIIVTGASGVLGSAIFNALTFAHHNVLGLAHSRAAGKLKQLDLLDSEKVETVFKEFAPDWVIHCAAERRPDVAEKDPEGTQKLNATLPGHLASLSASLHFKLIYISTDYVFDGANPPYAPDAPTNPLNLYGRTKRDGELAVLEKEKEGADVLVLRVPVLYGPAPKNSDSAINILLDVVQDQSGKKYKMDHYATRYPTNVLDIASFLVRLIALPTSLPKILHFSAPEPFTKYEICLLYALILGLPHTHITPDAEPYTGAAAASRPRDCKLDTTETERVLREGEGSALKGPGEEGEALGALGCVLFEEWWRRWLGVVPSGDATGEGSSR